MFRQVEGREDFVQLRDLENVQVRLLRVVPDRQVAERKVDAAAAGGHQGGGVLDTVAVDVARAEDAAAREAEPILTLISAAGNEGREGGRERAEVRRRTWTGMWRCWARLASVEPFFLSLTIRKDGKEDPRPPLDSSSFDRPAQCSEKKLKA